MMSFFGTILFFLLFRITDFLTSYFSPYYIPYLGFFPYKEIAEQFNLPKFITSFANFDGAHYLLIAKNGYTTYQQAFFPLYPLLIRWLSPIFSDNFLIASIFISNFSFLLGLFIFSKYLHLTGSAKHLIIWAIIFLLVFPTSFFFGAVYTEGLFFLLLVTSLYFLKKEKYFLTVVFTIMAALTKFLGVFLIIPVFFSILDSHLRGNDIKKEFSLFKSIKYLFTNYLLLATILSPIIGLSLYSFYLWQTVSDPLFFLNSQWAFGAHRSSSLVLLPQVYYRYLNIFFTAQFNFQYFISALEFAVFNAVLVILILDLIKNLKLKIKNYAYIGLNLFSLVNIILPTLTGTFSSVPRYALFSISFFIYLSQIKSFPLKLIIICILAILHIIILSFFSQGYFVS